MGGYKQGLPDLLKWRSMSSKRHKFCNLLVGAERSGKTFLASKVANKYTRSGKWAFVYNTGMPSDYAGFYDVELADSNETYYYILSVFGRDAAKLYRNSGSPIKFLKFGNDYQSLESVPLMRGKGFKADRLFGSDSDAFFKSVSSYFYDGLLIIDDAKPVVSGMGRNLSTVLSRKNHCGKNAKGVNRENIGIDVLIIYHNLDRVSPEVFDYCTHLTLFPTLHRPRLDRLENPEVEEIIMDTWERLDRERKLPGYSFDYYFINLKDPTGPKVVKCDGKRTNFI